MCTVSTLFTVRPLSAGRALRVPVAIVRMWTMDTIVGMRVQVCTGHVIVDCRGSTQNNVRSLDHANPSERILIIFSDDWLLSFSGIYLQAPWTVRTMHTLCSECPHVCNVCDVYKCGQCTQSVQCAQLHTGVHSVCICEQCGPCAQCGRLLASCAPVCNAHVVTRGGRAGEPGGSR